MAEVVIINEKSAPNCKYGLYQQELTLSFAASDASKAGALTYSAFLSAPNFQYSIKTLTAGGNLTDIKTISITTAATTTAVTLTAIANAAPGGSDTAEVIINVWYTGRKA